MSNENKELKTEGLNMKDLLSEKLSDALLPGVQIEFDPDEAEMLGAFSENALTEKEALISSVDNDNIDVVFIDDNLSILPIPTVPLVKDKDKDNEWIDPLLFLNKKQ